MGRFETLNADTQDLVEMLVPGLAQAWGLPEAVDIIPEEIRMRAWDCERREHIIDQTENDARNWGVQFLKDLMAIRRIIGPDIDRFHEDLFKKVMDHGDDHPWCRLQDIKDLKKMYEKPQEDEEEEEEEEEIESDFEHQELVMTGKKGALKGEPQFIPQYVPKKNKRLRRDSDGNLFRPEKKTKKKGKRTVVDDDDDEQVMLSENNITHDNYMPAVQMPYPMYAPGMHASQDLRGPPSRGPPSHARESSFDSVPASRGHRYSTAATGSPPPPGPSTFGPPSNLGEDAELSGEPTEVQALAAELAVAEAELKAARIRHKYLDAKAKAEAAASGE